MSACICARSTAQPWSLSAANDSHELNPLAALQIIFHWLQLGRKVCRYCSVHDVLQQPLLAEISFRPRSVQISPIPFWTWASHSSAVLLMHAAVAFVVGSSCVVTPVFLEDQSMRVMQRKSMGHQPSWAPFNQLAIA